MLSLPQSKDLPFPPGVGIGKGATLFLPDECIAAKQKQDGV